MKFEQPWWGIHKLWIYILGLTPKMDVVSLHDHKFKGEKSTNLSIQLWRDVSCWTIDVSLRYTNHLNEQEAKFGALYIFLTKKWVNVVMKYETILKNKVQWLMLEGLFGGNLSFLKHLFSKWHLILNGVNYGTIY
jgi:hypothetical protein